MLWNAGLASNTSPNMKKFLVPIDAASWSIAGENVGEGGQVSDSPDGIAHMAGELTSAMLN